jgi:hypothetical protein
MASFVRIPGRSLIFELRNDDAILFLRCGVCCECFSPPSCLVPGAGLGRLACEISRLGFITQGNEFSYYMLMCSSFILNQTQAPLEWTLHPWIHSNCNSLTDEDQLRAVQFPDLHPGRNNRGLFNVRG